MLESNLSSAPRVTVAIPTFNRRGLLQRALESALAQNYPNLEIIVSDNASEDGTPDYLVSVRDHRLRVLLNKTNIGMVPNWDRCLQAATGGYFLLMSDDDAFIGAEAVGTFVETFRAYGKEEVAFVFSDVILERPESSTTTTRTSAEKIHYAASELLSLFFENKISIFPCATMFRVADLKRLGAYHAFGAKLAVDACLWISLILEYRLAVRAPDSLCLYRVHNSLSSSSVDTWSDDFVIMRSIVERNRASLTNEEVTSIDRAITAAWNRTPLGYIARKRRFDANYTFSALIGDILKYRHRLLSASNLGFVFSRLRRESGFLSD